MISRASNSGLTVLVRFSCTAPHAKPSIVLRPQMHTNLVKQQNKKTKTKTRQAFPASFYGGEGNVLAISNFHSNAISANLLNRKQSCRNNII